MSPLRIIHLNSLLTGGGTDDQCVKVAHGLQQLGQDVRIAGPEGRDFSKIIHSLNVPFCDTGDTKSKLKFVCAPRNIFANSSRTSSTAITDVIFGRPFSPCGFLAFGQNSCSRVTWPKARVRGRAGNSCWAQCDALIAVSKFVEKILTARNGRSQFAGARTLASSADRR